MSTHDTSTAPTSTYRLQLRPGFTLEDAADLLDYLDRLGTGAVYLSPMLAAAPGSQHGYDVVDPTRVSPELGGDAAREALAAKAHELGLGVVADIVPNHMSVVRADANRWWWDVLAHGRDSVYARCFDIDFDAGPLLIPVLGDDGDGGRAALADLVLADGCLAYHDKRYPLAPGTHEPGDSVEAVHERQHYRLVSWRRGDGELTYRRFFDVSELAAVRVEDTGVFDATHAEILRWAELGQLDGLRVDHVDGLTDPGGYLRRLAERFGGWVVVEKILAPGEDLPQSWPVAGTTGYDALRELCGVFVDPSGEADLTTLALDQGVEVDVARADLRARRHAATELLRAEVRRIAALLPPRPERGRETPSPEAVRRREEAVAELLCAFDVYRSYLPEGERDWARAVETAMGHRPDLAHDLEALDMRVRRDSRGEAARRIQQTSGMVVAMGTENTAFYRTTRFVALNEVGGDPADFAVTPREFHDGAARREAARPHTMTTLSTHDTKRSEDVRARLAALSEMAEPFAEAVRRWTGRCALPEPALNLLGWQTLVGAWPIGEERLADYLLKAAREARLGTSWTEPDPDFEDRVRSWPARVLGDRVLRGEVASVVESVREAGWSNSLGQKAVQLLGPGVPDLYQGTELWDLSLVDPDNRRPVDHQARADLLTRIEDGWRPPVDATGAAKLHLVRTCLRARRELRPRGYLPLTASGPARDHALAFARTSAGADRPDLAVIATRLPVGLADAGGWADTVVALPSGPGTWTDRLTGRAVVSDSPDGPTLAHLAGVLDRYPVAVLTRE
ncbi:malto-oligosyltrehalose synthase [Nocardiopsis dassonvillei]|uniref:Malto-oligosyltrehalose synthase n=1 Tax=Nocardiopsis dassonvillei (strain ATCC 23218 / DSM 43111 / CIP 107115 / JCM 7437 / KCTC 9190 / NBRC 14626 / NCTC 10488 / NRRL B-5397 / IMRU 509) TaxID=446468 RepID=D7AVK2_NOCDD|nr:malto-oligosyltrehalose synthase [Nocardiopsis dassonvillei]ADH67691.1 malto-oligosyltrehalose synthase [Nocardiopsis dassonvillei subsp. dassonvillei DSM 43111]NKY81713.1 malto-oligosyltrehalose synthase [Nocardiopsis dassonvillei]VEI88090.1 Maltooligosyl trehalose synthase [Nocardiopsis dassonvillei]